MADIQALLTAEHMVSSALSVRVHGDIKEQTVRKGKFGIMLLGSPRLRIVRKGDELGRPQNIERHVVLNGAHEDARHNELQDDDKDQDGKDKAARGRNGKGTKNILEKNLGTVAHSAQAAR